MSENSITYVGPPELHCGHVLGVERVGDRATVHVRDADGRQVVLEFGGVADLAAVRPEGMLLHGLAELRPTELGRNDALRYFVFANEEEWDDASLEIAAREFWVMPAERPEPMD
ncbi:MAG: hypothetical protein M3303_16310 [Gemmatimonadota bacterium]|nr:hypothetical protein [Gemmatimonadota bacterium]